ncbi:MAG: glycosyl transferase family 1 [Crocinitomicaceae bacterium]|nr:glycosyl transferase family 1 [Crocinitomicaceae bacterium]MDP4760731.1 glycosyl transferase family 1 [Crocinitomicaceae bacterium]
MPNAKKVLIITYYWPPSGGSGVQRWLHFSRYLAQMGWEPIIYTPENAEAPIVDESLQDSFTESVHVIKYPIWEPFEAYKTLTGKKGKKLQTGFLNEGGKQDKKWIQKAALWLRANLFIPDAKKFWIKPSIKHLSDFLKDHPVDIIVSTGPPHTTHLIALGLKRATGTPWLADFRDPWTNIDWFDKLPMTNTSKRKHVRLEQQVLQEASGISCVSRTWTKEFEVLANRPVKLITNGFAPTDFLHFDKKSDPHFTILHTGSLNSDRNPHTFWKFLSYEIERNVSLKSKLKIQLVGAVDVKVIDSIHACGLSDFLDQRPFIPHQEVIELMSSCSLLLLPLNNVKNQQGIIPGKLFEYLASNQPILAIGPKTGDSAQILQEQANTMVIDFDEAPQWTEIEAMCQRETNRSSTLNAYSRQELAKEMSAFLDELILTSSK